MAKIDELEKGLIDQYGVPVRAELDKDGNEVGDPTPMAPPAHLRRSLTMAEQIQQMIRREVSLRSQEDGFETFEESDDFEIDDDPPDPHTPYEAVFDPRPPVEESDDGNATVDEGRPEPPESRSGKSGKVGKGKSGKESTATDQGSSRETDTGDQGSDAQD